MLNLGRKVGQQRLLSNGGHGGMHTKLNSSKVETDAFIRMPRYLRSAFIRIEEELTECVGLEIILCKLGYLPKFIAEFSSRIVFLTSMLKDGLNSIDLSERH